ncbi:hypothetical protein M408DRAFT_327156 [Serendipita vermifera MAFF 305830]|uniref:Lethal giant larvae (Lgl)-like C-terminal domain-containing protein n=1 Tax=Serendipita vermifera MAFF 305830 TaxID=933852 RepID=A0A0C2X080_SERVB|nr:hypothetical protein M408DRAFT_327156 [Serendipita vermifera MAFF 305830]
MSIFRKKLKGGPNVSQRIQSEHTWRLEKEGSFTAGERVTAVAYDPLLQVFACGFANGELHLYGSAPVHFAFHIPDYDGQGITHIQIASTSKRLICLDGVRKMVVWSLDGKLEDKPLAVTSFSDGIAFVGVSPVHSHAFIPHSDGTVHLYDLSRLCQSPSKVVPSPEVSEEVIMDLISSPNNADFIVVATYGSIYLWQFTAHQSPRTFILPDGDLLRPVCLAFHPKESIFAAGLMDGRIAFWSLEDSVPLWVTTISELIGEVLDPGAAPKEREPVFKLSWSSLSMGTQLTILGGQPAGRRLITLEFAGTPFSETDQLVSKSSITYDDFDTENIKDFVVAECILALKDDGSVIPILSPSSTTTDDPIPSQVTHSLYVPYELRRPIFLGQATTCSLEQLRQILPDLGDFNSKLIANGGVSYPHLSKDGPDPRLAKYDTPLILIALNEDGIIHFDDISSRLWIESEPLKCPYPNPLFNLSIDLKRILDEPLLWATLEDASYNTVQDITFIPEALELYVLFKTGQLLLWKYVDQLPKKDTTVNSDEHLMDLSTLMKQPQSFNPQFLFSSKKGKCLAFATCEIGFAALAYQGSSVYVLDMRGPRVMSHQHLRQSEGDDIVKMHFTICHPEPKAPERLYLLVHHASGAVSILMIRKEASIWTIDRKVEEIPSRKSLPHPVSCLLVDILTGEELKASAKAFESMFSEKVDDKNAKLSFEGSFYRVTVSDSAVRCDTGLTGKNIKTVEVGGALKAGLITVNASSALALFRTGGILTILSLPNLETIASFQEKAFTDSSMFTAQVMTSSGDISIQLDRNLEIWSTLSSPRVVKPDISIPLNPSAPLSQGGLISWLLGSHPMTGEEFDNLVAGPNRPPAPSVSPPQSSSHKGNELQDAIAATEERGHLIATLGDKADELGFAAEGMAAQAQKLATKAQTKKRRFGF